MFRAMGPARDDVPAEELRRITEILLAEYSVLSGSLSSVWSASLTRTSLFLGVLSAVFVALGFAAQAEGGIGGGGVFQAFALAALPLALLLGIATFVRTVELQREAIVYITGMNRIRGFLVARTPGAAPYLVLSTHDDMAGVYRNQGTGIRLRPPRPQLLFALVQTQGIIAITCASLTAGIVGVATMTSGSAWIWPAAAAAFVVVVVALFAYWQHAITGIQTAIRPLDPTPPEHVQQQPPI